jgi:O-acetyl-ADP-ribose deacetylase (regulator of RNase III)
MEKYQEIEGDLIKLALQGTFDVIAQGCNCFCTMGAGLAPQMAKTFGCDEFNLEQLYKLEYIGEEDYAEIPTKNKGNINKLGQIDYRTLGIKDNKVYYAWDSKSQMQKLVVINTYTQYMYGTNHIDGVSKPLDYEALTLCLRKINHTFKDQHIGLPLIGCYLAGGVWDKNDLPLKMLESLSNNFKDVKTIIQEELKDMNVTIVHYKP